MEAGHGKGAPDGVGGVLKRTADSLVAQGKDIPNAHKLYESLKSVTSINLILVTDDEIKKFDDKIPTDVISINGTMKIHQVNLLYYYPVFILNIYIITSMCDYYEHALIEQSLLFSLQ